MLNFLEKQNLRVEFQNEMKKFLICVSKLAQSALITLNFAPKWAKWGLFGPKWALLGRFMGK